MTDTPGGRLRQRREQQQITLATISEQTKIKLSLLEDLERDDLSRWPSGIFRRAFVRAYALAIGMDPEAVMRDVMERHPDPGEVIETESPLGGDSRSSAGPPTRFRYLVGSALRRLPTLSSKPAVPAPSHAGKGPPSILAAAPPDPPPALTDPPTALADPPTVLADPTPALPERPAVLADPAPVLADLPPAVEPRAEEAR